MRMKRSKGTHVPMLPEVTSFSNIEIDEPTTIITVAGFEERASVIFEDIESRGMEGKIQNSISITYKPEKERNDANAIREGLANMGVDQQKNHWLTFNRYEPEPFESDFMETLKRLGSERVLLDISGMSKYLIMLSLHLLAQEDIHVTIFHAEAETYHPTRSELQRKWTGEPEETPAFLTYGIYDIVTSKSLSSVVNSGQPIAIVAFPSFNYKKLVALVSEISPQTLISILGMPKRSEDAWRMEAIKELNRDLEAHARIENHRTSTFDYSETVELLDRIYNEYADAHRMVLAPTGSKMQTVGSAIFRQVYDDIQVVYPVMEEFSDPYTEGCRATWGIELGQIDEQVELEKSDSVNQMNHLREMVSEINKQTRAD